VLDFKNGTTLRRASSEQGCSTAAISPDVGGDEEGDTGAQPVSLLQQLVQADDNDAREEELHDDEDGVAGAQVPHVSVHP